MQILYECLVCTREADIIEMIRSFKDKETEKVFQGRFSKRIPPSIAKTALRKLMAINAAESLYKLKAVPANRLEKLWGIGKGSGAFASTINGELPSNRLTAGKTMKTFTLSIITKRRKTWTESKYQK